MKAELTVGDHKYAGTCECWTSISELNRKSPRFDSISEIQFELGGFELIAGHHQAQSGYLTVEDGTVFRGEVEIVSEDPVAVQSCGAWDYADMKVLQHGSRA